MNIDDILSINTGSKTMTKQPVQKLELREDRDAMHLNIIDKVRLNRYDTKFMSNILDKYISKGKPLSPGQNDLYEKIIHKYRKQLKKLGVNYKRILELPWANGVIDPAVLTGQTYFRIVDGEMLLYFNFNKSRIDEVRSLVHDDAGKHINRGNTNSNFGNGQKYKFEWDKSEKVWRGPFNLYLFRTLYDWAIANNIRIEESVSSLVNKLNAYGNKEDWTPSIRIVNDRLYINIIAESMLPVLEDVDMSDTSAENIERLVMKLGLAVPASYKAIADYMEGHEPDYAHVIADNGDVAILRDYLFRTGRKAVFLITEINTYKPEKLIPVSDLTQCETWGPTEHYLVGTSGPSYRMKTDSINVDKLIEEGYNTLITTTTLTSLLRNQSEVGKFALEADKIINLSIRTT